MDKLLQLALALKEVRGQVKQIQSTASDIQKQEGKQGIPGKQGERGVPGKDGTDGKNGKDGKDGKDGNDGKDGISVTDAYTAADGNLVIVLSDGKEIDVGAPLLTDKPSIIASTIHHPNSQQSSFYTGVTSVTTNILVGEEVSTVFVDASSGAITITMPLPTKGKIITIKKMDQTVNEVFIIPHGVELIEEDTDAVINVPRLALKLQSDGTNWQIV